MEKLARLKYLARCLGLLFPAMTALSQDKPTFECSRTDIYNVAARFVNSTDTSWFRVGFKATVKLINRDGLALERTRDGRLEEELRPHTSGPVTFTSPLSPDSGLKIESCVVEFVEGQRVSLRDRETTDPDLESVFVAADKACLTDYLQALQLEGLALRKQLAALMEFGCVKRLRKGYLVNVINRSILTVNGRKIAVADAWFLANEALLSLGQKFDPGSQRGFIPLSQIKVAPTLVLEDVPKK